MGKSTFSTNLATALSNSELHVGLMDTDICGPSLPRMMGVLDETIHSSNSGWSPVYVSDNLAVVSIGFMLQNQDEAVIWRGPRKNGIYIPNGRIDQAISKGCRLGIAGCFDRR